MTTAGVTTPKRAAPFGAGQILGAVALVITFVGAAGTWGSLAPLGSAVVAAGIVSVETHRQAVQHLEGGIVDRILIREGTRVRRGDVLVELRDVAIAASTERLRSQYYEAAASAARLVAERDGQADIVFPEALIRASLTEQAAVQAMDAQRGILASRRDLQTQQLTLLARQIDRRREEVDGLGAQLDAVRRQLALTDLESRDATQLLGQQLIRRPRVIEIERNRAQLEERQSSLQSSLLQGERHIAELEVRMREHASAAMAQIVADLRASQARAHELSRELAAAQDILDRMQVRAPIDGTVVGLRIHSRDGVIAPGQTLMEIVPLGDTLVIDARVRPEDIEEVRAGLPVTVVLNTLTRRYNTPLRGMLDSVSADRLIDEPTGRPFYRVRVRLDPDSPRPADVKLMAGMSADVFIQTGERTALAYLAAPLLRTFHRGMREQ